MSEDKQVKLAEEDMQKLAQQEQFDREQGFEMGFAKAAQDLGLDATEFQTLYQIGCQKLAAESCDDEEETKEDEE